MSDKIYNMVYYLPESSLSIGVSPKVVKLLSGYRSRIGALGSLRVDIYKGGRDNILLDDSSKYMVSLDILITEYPDEWFHVEFDFKFDTGFDIKSRSKRYSCDGFDGLVELLRDFSFNI